MKTSVLFMCLSLFAVACNSDDDNSATPTDIQISGISETDDTGNAIYPPDTTDWRFDDTFPVAVEQLFDPINNGVTATTIPMGMFLGVAPNPATGIQSYYLQIDSTQYIDMRLVDRELKVIVQLDSLRKSSHFVDLSGPGIENDTLYRWYYKVYGNGNVYRGHGDVKRHL